MNRGHGGSIEIAAIVALLAGGVAASAAWSASPSARRWEIVVCAPGFPGNTAQAQPSMDSFARGIEKAAGLPASSLGAVYFETAAGGLDRLSKDPSAFALVPLPFFLENAAALKLDPKLAVVPLIPSARPGEEAREAPDSSEVWSLVARKGTVTSAGSLAEWEVTGGAGYSPAFVRGPLLGDWGPLPATARITFTPRVLTSLRRAAGGEKLAVIVDRASAEAIPTLPFAAELEIAARSKPLPGMLLCIVGERIGRAEAGRILLALMKLHEKPGGEELLRSLRMARFVSADTDAIEKARRSFIAAGGGG